MAKTMEEVLERFRTIEFHEDFDMIVAIANGGIVPAGFLVRYEISYFIEARKENSRKMFIYS